MKNKTKITNALRALLVCGFLLSTSFLRAQICNVTINNNLPCDVQLDIEFFEIPPAGCAACIGNPINVTVTNSGGSTTLKCGDPALWGCANTICDISVTFTNPFTAGPFLFTGGSQPLPGSPCGSSVNANITFNATSIDINP